MLTDTHVHLDFPDFAPDLEAVIERALAAGVTRMISIGTTVENSQNAVALAERFPPVWAAVGIHPNHAH
jgi:TatD DNase family protein